MRFSNKLIAILAALLILSSLAFSQTKNRIVGQIVDGDTGEGLIGVNVIVEGTLMGSATDLNGDFRIENVPFGAYNIIGSYMGYTQVKIKGVEVNAGDPTRINFSMTMQVLEGEEVVVTAKAVKNTESALLKDRQKSASVSDAVSSEAISRAGSGNAADAMKQVTGASVVGGKEVFIRGLGDRYTSTQLNGAEIPSTNPYKRSASIDLIPSNLVDNIVTTKSFTPDKPGDFSGGAVDIRTKDFPEDLQFSVSASSAYNPQVNLNSNGPLGYQGSATDWLGMDDGFRKAPLPVGSYIPDLGTARNDRDAAFELDDKVSQFNNIMVPEGMTPGLDQSYSVSLGNQFDFGGKPFGYIGSLTYKNSYNSYDGGEYQRWILGSGQADFLTSNFDLTDTRTSHEVLWGALLKMSYQLANNHVVSFNGMYNQNGEATARYLEGRYPYDLGDDDLFMTSQLGYNERRLQNYQMRGEHVFTGLGHLRLDWQATVGSSDQDEPDSRYFTSFRNVRGYYGIATNVPPARYYRGMHEDRQEYKVDFSLPISQWQGKMGTLKFGGLYSNKKRDFSERYFEYQQEPVFAYEGDADEFFSEENTGLIDSTVFNIAGQEYKVYDLGLILRENYVDGSEYNGDQAISAGYVMLDMPLLNKLRFIGGVRYETTDLYLEHNAQNQPNGDLETGDLLPSANFVYGLKPNMNLRAAYGRTLARPLFREVAPYASFDFVGGTTFIGNPELDRTLVENFDLRWEWFVEPGELIAVSAFGKLFSNPIEPVIINDKNYVKWQNVDQATVLGIEFEARKHLDFIAPKLSNFMLGGNLSLVNSQVDIAEDQLTIIRETRPDAESTRPFQGQSPYLLNINFAYDNYERGFNATLFYNLFGERLSVVSLGGTPDVYEQPAGLLNFTASYKFKNHWNIGFKAMNILDSENLKVHRFQGKEYTYEAYKFGRQFSVSLKYEL